MLFISKGYPKVVMHLHKMLRNQGGTTAETKQRLSSLDNAQCCVARRRQTFFISERNEFYDVSRNRRDKRIS